MTGVQRGKMNTGAENSSMISEQLLPETEREYQLTTSTTSTEKLTPIQFPISLPHMHRAKQRTWDFQSLSIKTIKSTPGRSEFPTSNLLL
jgi:hypothetical protein